MKTDSPDQISNELSFKEVIEKVKFWITYLKSKWLLILLFGVISGVVGFVYAWKKKPIYSGNLTFVLEEDKSTVGNGLAGALGIAGSLGIDIGGAGSGAFSGANLIELMKSRTLIQKALMHPISVDKSNESLADYLIELLGLYNSDTVTKIKFPPFTNAEKFTIKQDSLINILWDKIVSPGGILTVSQRDKKISIITVQSQSESELFAKVFTEVIAQVVSDFYIETKSKKAKQNLEMLEKQTDSVRSELNKAITGVAIASDQTYNLNPALNVKRTPSLQKQIDVQTNTAVLTQLVPNLEMAKLSLYKETPLIQIIDRPVYPLSKKKIGKTISIILFSLIGSFLISLILVIKKLIQQLLL